MKNIISLLAIFIAIWIIILIPFKVIGYGFMPPDDAMRHSAKVISGKDWSQILVLRDEIKLDSYPGWHAILAFVHRITCWDQHSLVLFSTVSLFLAFCLLPLFFLKLPESWLASLLILAIFTPEWIFRLFLGRPYLFTMASLLLILLIWPTFKEKKYEYINVIILTVIAALSVWIHASWYFFLLLMAAFMLAREWRASAIIAISSIMGVLIGASFTGHPILFLKQEVTHLFLVFGSYDVERQLVGELRPAFGDYRVVLIILMMLGWRALRGLRFKDRVDNPVFMVVILSFILGFLTSRFWLDWGMTALAVWISKEFEEFFAAKINPFSWRRIALVIILAIVLYLAVTVDANSRWSLTRPLDYISSEDPEQAEWLPSPGGIIYSDDMRVFYQIFFKNPKASWRYILGFESAFMRPEDLKILREIQRYRKIYKTYVYFEPWVKKMRPEDRLIIRNGPEGKPNIPELEWHYLSLDTWSGRKPSDRHLK